MKSGTATANLTVNKAEGSGIVTVSDVVYGSIPSPAASSETTPGEVIYLYKLSEEADTSYSSEVPTEPGDYMVKAVFSASNLYNECSAEATFSIMEKEKISVNIIANNKTVTYDGNAIDISDMFEIPEYAGAVTYEVVSETAELNGHFLTVRKAGTYVIGVHTEETVLYEAGSAAADLIVKKAHGEGSVSISDVEFGSKPSPSVTSSTKPGDPVFLYKLSSEGDNTYSSNVPTAPGKYTVRAIFPDTDLYELTLTKEFTIKEDTSNANSGNTGDETMAEAAVEPPQM